MPIIGILDPIRALGKEYVIVTCSMLVGASGAVTSVTGRGFSSALPSGETPGGIVKEATAGQYTVTLPGRGSVQAIIPLGAPVIEHATDVLHITVISKALSSRALTFQCWDADTPAATNPTSGAVLHFAFLVKNSNELA